MDFKFIVPLKSVYSHTEGDWSFNAAKASKVFANLTRTLLSINNAYLHVDPKCGLSVEILIGCHEDPLSPDLGELTIDVGAFATAVSVVPLVQAFDRPINKEFYMTDKRKKVKACVEHMRKANRDGETFVMLLDADDVVSETFFNSVIEIFHTQACDDICFMSGYVYDDGNGVLGFLNGHDRVFYKNCGSCFVSRISHKTADYDYLFELKNHTKFPDIASRHRRVVYDAFRPEMLYIVNHGENDVSERFSKRRMVKFVKTYRSADSDIQGVLSKFNLIDA